MQWDAQKAATLGVCVAESCHLKRVSQARELKVNYQHFESGLDRERKSVQVTKQGHVVSASVSPLLALCGVAGISHLVSKHSPTKTCIAMI